MIVFQNPGEIDIRAISTLGISVKESENPIGFFGTGLKYALAILLRNGHKVSIHSGLSVIDFGVASHRIRGEDFDIITMAIDGAPPTELGITTQLGKTWEMWMAYREIYCNCKDEGGAFSVTSSAPEPREGFTSVCVSGDNFEQIHYDRHQYLIEDEPDFVLGSMEIRRREGHGFFYRGVLVSSFGMRSMYTYNEQQKMLLTEDRTVRDHYDVQRRLAAAVMNSSDRSFIRSVVTANKNFKEAYFDFHWSVIKPGPIFIDVVGECMAKGINDVNQTARMVFDDHMRKHFTPRQSPVTAVQKKTIEKALDFCATIGFEIREKYPILIAESLGNNTLGLAKDDTIYISERAFQLGGTKQVASTLIEEYLHLRHGWQDCTRELQTFLFEKMVSLGEELTGEPL